MKYSFKIFYPSEEPLNKKNEAVDLIVYKDNKEYTGSIMTLDYLNYIFDKNKKSGEFRKGIYFPLDRWIIIKDLNKKTIRKALDDLIERKEFNDFFK